jgi:hypothetical protein
VSKSAAAAHIHEKMEESEEKVAETHEVGSAGRCTLVNESLRCRYMHVKRSYMRRKRYVPYTYLSHTHATRPTTRRGADHIVAKSINF